MDFEHYSLFFPDSHLFFDWNLVRRFINKCLMAIAWISVLIDQETTGSDHLEQYLVARSTYWIRTCLRLADAVKQ